MTLAFYLKQAKTLLAKLDGLDEAGRERALSGALFEAYSTGLARKGAKAELREKIQQRRIKRVAEEESLLGAGVIEPAPPADGGQS